MKERILITGVTGQDGSILTRQYLKETNAFVYGLVRRSSTSNLWRIEDSLNNERFEVVEGDITDMSSLIRIFRLVKPDKIYSLASQSHVRISFEEPIHTLEVTGKGPVNIYETARNVCPNARIYQASSSEQFGSVLETPQTEKTPFNPVSPYAVSKVYAHQMAEVYKKSYGMFISQGILFNHESPYRGENFVTRKITKGVANIIADKKIKSIADTMAGNQTKGIKQETIKMGNLLARRDWGYAPDYTRGMKLMLEHSKPDDFILATGITYSVNEFLKICCELVGLDWKKVYEKDERFMRPVEVNLLKGDASKIKNILGWVPTTSFSEMVEEMLRFDFKLVGLELDDYACGKGVITNERN